MNDGTPMNEMITTTQWNCGRCVMVINHLVLPCSMNHRCKNLPTRLHRQLNYVLWHQIFVSPQCETCYYVTLMAPKILRRLLELLKNLSILALPSYEVQTMAYVKQNTCKEANMVSAPNIPIITLYLPSQNLVPHLFVHLSKCTDVGHPCPQGQSSFW